MSKKGERAQGEHTLLERWASEIDGWAAKLMPERPLCSRFFEPSILHPSLLSPFHQKGKQEVCQKVVGSNHFK
ncbi:MAG: hypothetical protein ABSG85_04030 [Spirochaetia bacterium]|jgi:hypothetical protein